LACGKDVVSSNTVVVLLNHRKTLFAIAFNDCYWNITLR
jgi:hypothetical protein